MAKIVSQPNLLVLVIGEPFTGKTSLIKRLRSDKLSRRSKATVCIEFCIHDIMVKNGNLFRVEIWDAAGDAKYRALACNHFKRSDGAMIVFSLCDRASFDAIPNWLEAVKENCSSNMKLMIVGNKLDLVCENESQRQVTTYEAEKFAKSINAKYIEVSAVTKQGVKDAFSELANSIYFDKACVAPPSRETIELNNSQSDENESSCCGIWPLR